MEVVDVLVQYLHGLSTVSGTNYQSEWRLKYPNTVQLVVRSGPVPPNIVQYISMLMEKHIIIL
jgi:hypothetical protein